MEKLRIGTMGWSYDFWTGRFYVSGINRSEYLSEYSKHFNSVEVNSTFYRIPSKTTVSRWHSQTPEDFVFSVKLPKAVTHSEGLAYSEEKLETFLRNISILGNKLGPLLIQFPPKFKVDEYEALKDFLYLLPDKYRFTVEFRHKGWFEDKVFKVLTESGVALVLTDGLSIHEIETTTSDFIYIRWEGDRKKVKGDLGRIEVDKSEKIAEWALRITKFLDDSLDVYGYFSKFYSGNPPTDVEQLLENISQINKSSV
jgi:uncharacterized protein YecE (DUF72 family)